MGRILPGTNYRNIRRDFVYSCYLCGIHWIPPYILDNLDTLPKTYLCIWQRKVRLGKIKLQRTRHDKDFMEKYRKALKEATRISGRIDENSLDPEFRELVEEKRRLRRKREANEKLIKSLDDKIYPKKVYPWYYDLNGEPQVYRMGFYFVKAGQDLFASYYPKEELEKIHWIRGEKALLRGYNPTNRLLIGGRLVPGIHKLKLDDNNSLKNHTSIKAIKRNIGKKLRSKRFKSSRKREEYINESMDRYNYGTKEFRHMQKPVSEKQIQLSQAKKARAQRKKDLYEE